MRAQPGAKHGVTADREPAIAGRSADAETECAVCERVGTCQLYRAALPIPPSPVTRGPPNVGCAAARNYDLAGIIIVLRTRINHDISRAAVRRQVNGCQIIVT